MCSRVDQNSAVIVPQAQRCEGAFPVTKNQLWTKTPRRWIGILTWRRHGPRNDRKHKLKRHQKGRNCIYTWDNVHTLLTRIRIHISQTRQVRKALTNRAELELFTRLIAAENGVVGRRHLEALRILASGVPAWYADAWVGVCPVRT